LGAPYNTPRAPWGRPRLAHVRKHVFTDRPWLAADPTLSPWREPADLEVVQTGAWILPDERPLPADLEAFLNAGTPPVYVGFGSIPMRASQDIARDVIEAIRAQGRRALVARGWAELALTDERNDCFVVGEVNQQALFGRVAAVVHHGGAGTTTTATRAGAPQVVVPQMGDQPYRAGRVAELGIGAAHEVRLRPSSPCQPRSGPRWPPRPAHERAPWPARSAPTGRRWPRSCCSARTAEKGRRRLREPRGIVGLGKGVWR
jgi:vancomycin aglycone glucosyltransferase